MKPWQEQILNELRAYYCDLELPAKADHAGRSTYLGSNSVNIDATGAYSHDQMIAKLDTISRHRRARLIVAHLSHENQRTLNRFFGGNRCYSPHWLNRLEPVQALAVHTPTAKSTKQPPYKYIDSLITKNDSKTLTLIKQEAQEMLSEALTEYQSLSKAAQEERTAEKQKRIQQIRNKP